jgi:hypothetical protein
MTIILASHLTLKVLLLRSLAELSFVCLFVLKCIVTRDSVFLIRAFCTFVRPILEFSSIMWSPFYKNEIVKIEMV